MTESDIYLDRKVSVTKGIDQILYVHRFDKVFSYLILYLSIIENHGIPEI